MKPRTSFHVGNFPRRLQGLASDPWKALSQNLANPHRRDEAATGPRMKHAHIPTPEPPQPEPDIPPKPPEVPPRPPGDVPPRPPDVPPPIDEPPRRRDPPVKDPPPDETPNPPRY